MTLREFRTILVELKEQWCCYLRQRSRGQSLPQTAGGAVRVVGVVLVVAHVLKSRMGLLYCKMCLRCPLMFISEEFSFCIKCVFYLHCYMDRPHSDIVLILKTHEVTRCKWGSRIFELLLCPWDPVGGGGPVGITVGWNCQWKRYEKKWKLQRSSIMNEFWTGCLLVPAEQRRVRQKKGFQN